MVQHREIPFKVELPCSVFEKADAPAGQRRRIGGVISAETEDRQGDTLIQKGLDFTDFLTNGWYNDNHSKETTGVLGYPESVQQFAKGEQLPDGSVAQAPCTWAEGYLLDNWEPANRIWELGKALQGTGRRLGFSVEGAILRRTGSRRKTVAQAKVRNVAITNCPVSTETGLNILSKSLEIAESVPPADLDRLVEAGDLNDRLTNLETMLEKALTMGTPANPPASPAGEGPKTGEGAGQVLARQSLEMDEKEKDEDEIEDEYRKSLSDAEAIEWVRARIPTMTLVEAGRFVESTKALKRQGRL